MNTQSVELIKRSRCECGCDWGIDRAVLVRLLNKNGQPVKELWWMGGHSYWSGRGQTSYARASLRTAEKASWNRADYIGGADTKTDTLAEGRVGQKTIASQCEAIDAFFGCKVSHLIDIKKTLIIEE